MTRPQRQENHTFSKEQVAHIKHLIQEMVSNATGEIASEAARMAVMARGPNFVVVLLLFKLTLKNLSGERQ